MGLFKRIMRLFTTKGNKVLKKYEDKVELYEYELEKSKGSLDKLSESQSRLRADKRVVQDKHAKAVEYLASLERILDRAIEQNDDDLGEDTISVADATRKKIQMLEISIESYDNVVKQLDDQAFALRESYNEKASKLDGLKAQNEFAKNMETINLELKTHYSQGEFDFSSFEKLETELTSKIYYEQDRNAQLAPPPSLEQRANKLTKQSRFEEYKAAKQARIEGNTSALDAPKEKAEEKIKA